MSPRRPVPDWLPFVLAILAYAAVRLIADAVLRSWMPEAEDPATARSRWVIGMLLAVLTATAVLLLAARWARRR